MGDVVPFVRWSDHTGVMEMPRARRLSRSLIVLTAIAALGAAAVPPASAAPAMLAPLPEVVSLDPGDISLQDFSGPEQEAAPYLGLVAMVANSVDDENPETYGLIRCECWRVGEITDTNARVQENILTLAYFYSVDRPWNPYYGDEALRLRLEAAIDYWVSLQNDDGSFPQFGTDTHSRPATNFALDYVARSTLDVLDRGPGIDPMVHERLVQAARRAAEWFLTDEEEVWTLQGEKLSNQVVGGMVGISGLLPRFGDDDLEELFEQRVVEMTRELQGPPGYYYEGGVGHRYSIEVLSRDLALWAHDETWPLVLQMQERYVDWLNYQLLPEPDRAGFFINTALDTRHARWHHLTELQFGANNLWSRWIPAAAAFGPTAEDVVAAREEWWQGTWSTSVQPGIEARRQRVDPADIRDLLAEEHYPTAAEKAAATDGLRSVAASGFTEWSRADKVDQQFLYTKRSSLVFGLSAGAQPTIPPGRATGGRVFVWDRPRYGANYLWHADMGMLIQSQNATAFGDPGQAGITNEFSWSTIAPGATAGTWRVEAYEEADVAYRQDGQVVEHPAPASAGSVEATLVPRSQPWIEKAIGVDDDGVTVAVDLPGSFTEQIPIVIGADDDLQWLGGDQVTLPEETGATGLLIGRNGSALAISWGAEHTVSLRPAGVTMFDGDRELYLLTIQAADRLEYRLSVTADACLNSIETETVTIGGADTGVANVDRGDGCFVADLIDDDLVWASHGAFVRHVQDVADELVADETMTPRDRSRLVAAAAHSAIGRDRVQIQLTVEEVAPGDEVTGLAVAPAGTRITVSGDCAHAGELTLGADGGFAVATRGGIPDGLCELTFHSRFPDGGAESDLASVRLFNGPPGVVFSDSFDDPAAPAWQPVAGIWAVEDGTYAQRDAGSFGKRTVLRDVTLVDGAVETDIQILDDAGNPGNWAGVQLRTTEPGDNFTVSGYMVYVRANGELNVFSPAGAVLAAAPTGADPAAGLRLRVETVGDQIRVYVDGATTPLATVTDTDFVGGYVALITGRTHARFDDVVVERLAPTSAAQ